MSEALFIHGDARRLPIDPKAIDAIIGDPPYGIDNDCDYTRFSSGDAWNKNNTFKPIHGDKEPFDPAPWIDFPKVILWGANFYSNGLPGGGWLVWVKKPTSNIGKFMGDCEVAWTNKGQAVYLFHHVWMGLVRESEMGKSLHPTQKPVALMRWCIQRLKLQPNSLIVDPWCGSGPVAIAAAQEGHRFIGLDLDRDYLMIAKQRLERPHLKIQRAKPDAPRPLFAGLGDDA